MKKLFFKAEKTENERLDVFLAGAAEGLSRAHALKLIESRMGKELSANALQEHFTQPYAGQPSIPLSVMVEGQEDKQGYSGGEYENHSGGMNLFAPEGPAVDAEEEAFIRAMQRKKKKKKRKGLGM